MLCELRVYEILCVLEIQSRQVTVESQCISVYLSQEKKRKKKQEH